MLIRNWQAPWRVGIYSALLDFQALQTPARPPLPSKVRHMAGASAWCPQSHLMPAHLTAPSTESWQVISPELGEQIYLTLGVVHQMPLPIELI